MMYTGKHATLDALHSQCEAKILPNPVYGLGVVSVPDPNQLQRGSLSVKAWERD